MYQADLGIAKDNLELLILPSDEMTVMFHHAQCFWGSKPDLFKPQASCILGKHSANPSCSLFTRRTFGYMIWKPPLRCETMFLSPTPSR